MKKRPLLVASLNLAAMPTAVSCSRMFVRHTLDRWNVPHLSDAAELVASELTTNAVKATGLMTPEPSWAERGDLNLLTVRIFGCEDCICLQVWDVGEEPLDPPTAGADDEAEGGRGLFIVDSLARKVGHFYPKVGGKVVWAELALDAKVPSLPRRQAKKPTLKLPRADPELLRKLLDKLQKL